MKIEEWTTGKVYHADRGILTASPPMTVQFIPVVAPRAAASPRGAVSLPEDSGWVDAVRRAALVVFPAVVVFSVLVPARAGRVFWTVAIAGLPLFF
jgi:hypothetical protein